MTFSLPKVVVWSDGFVHADGFEFKATREEEGIVSAEEHAFMFLRSRYSVAVAQQAMAEAYNIKGGRK